MKLDKIAVFCGANFGNRETYRSAAERLGRTLALQRRGLVYGGGNVGLMGALADAALSQGGEVIGVIPQHLVDREVGHRGVSRLEIVSSMHERKARMAELSDAFIALPGGLGTLDEIFEIATWSQLGLHKKPIAFWNVDGYYTTLFQFLDEMTSNGLVRPQHRAMLYCEEELDAVFGKLETHLPISLIKWAQPTPETSQSM